MINSQPVDEFHRLNHRLMPSGTPFEYAQGSVIVPEESNELRTYVFLEGAISLERQNNRLLLGVVAAPGIFGLGIGAMPTQEHYHLHVETSCRGYHLPASTTLQLLDKYQLWRDAFYWMTWQNRALEARDQQLIGTSSYAQIRATLLTMAKWDDALRARLGVMTYIQRRTLISRSVIAEVLAALRQGDYIRMEKGKLVCINRLPLDY